MIDQFGDWDVVSRKTNKPALHLFWILLQIPLAAAGGGGPVEGHSTVTWTLRNRSTGETRRVTADSESQAAELIAAGKFHRFPRWRPGPTVPQVPKSE